MEFFTLGVYHSTEAEFFDKLTQNGIDTFCDIRQLRGVRGAQYAFVNSNRLQQKLADLSIKYEYVPGLAPTSEIRGLQKELDREKGVAQRERQELGEKFVHAYRDRILDNFDFERFFEWLEESGAGRVALFCVEEHAGACHRSVVAEKLWKDYDYKVTHL